MTTPDLSPRDLAFLQQLASGRKMEAVPAALVEAKLVKRMTLKQAGDLVSNVWVVTKLGRIEAASDGKSE